MRTFLVVNPRSANGVTGRRWLELSAQVERALGPFGHGFTRGAMDAARLAREALEAGYECIVAVGGDGTLNEVTNGFFRDGRPINPRAALGVLPRGTGGDFRRSFGWPLDLGSALERLKGERTEPFDVGLVEYAAGGGGGARETRYFANVASFGVSSVVAQEVNRGSKALGGRLSFMWGSVKGLLKYRDRRVRVRLDDGPPQTLDVTAVVVANGRYFGGGMCVAPDALTSDGLLDVTIWSGYGLTDFALKSAALYSGAHVHHPNTRQLRCRTLWAESEEETVLELDGEVPGALPCRMSVLPAAIRLKV